MFLVLCWLLVGVQSRVDTQDWIGAAYTPSGASNTLWWHWYDDYEEQVIRELEAVNRHMGFTALRVFLHNMVYQADGPRLMDYMDRFLHIAQGHGIRVGFVFFGDCFNGTGASVETQCVPRKGVHNSCWKASPQADDRGSIVAHRAYVVDVVTRFRNDSRVLWWEVYNEPVRSDNYSIALRQAAHGWATDCHPKQPVIACWDDNPATDIVDHHVYSPNLPHDWTYFIYSNTDKGALVTEGGSRWYQHLDNAPTSDNGSPLIVIHYVELLKQTSRPFIPGVMICWEVMVGNSNTRWYWRSPAGSREPVIPFDAWLFPDGTPVSYTEAHAVRNYITGASDLVFLETFLPPSLNMTDDVYFSFTDTSPVWTNTAVHITDNVIEVPIWPETSDAVVTVNLRTTQHEGYAVTLSVSTQCLSVSRVSNRVSKKYTNKILGVFNTSSLECGTALHGWNMLRIGIVQHNIQLWYNPMWTDTQPLSPSGHPRRIVPRLSVVDPNPLEGGGVFP